MTVIEEVDARKTRLGPEDTLKLAKAASEIWVAKGKSVVHLDLRKSPPDDATLLAALLGPSGMLRAPVLRRGKKLLVGFDSAMYQEQFAK